MISSIKEVKSVMWAVENNAQLTVTETPSGTYAGLMTEWGRTEHHDVDMDAANWMRWAGLLQGAFGGMTTVVTRSGETTVKVFSFGLFKG